MFKEMENFRNTTGKPIKSEKLYLTIQQKLKIDVKKLGVLDEPAQKDLTDDALKRLEKTDVGLEEKNYAFLVLASINQIKIPTNWLEFLLQELYFGKYSETSYTRSLIATSLFPRFNQENFGAAMISFLRHSKMQTNSERILREIKKLSLVRQKNLKK